MITTFLLLTVLAAAVSTAGALDVGPCPTCPSSVLAVDSESSSRKKDVVLESYREGLLALVDGRLDAAVFHLQEAERDIERLRPKSITEATSSIILNDRSRSYIGEDFEQAYVNYFLAVAFLQRGELSEAMVEARRLNETLKELNRVYGDAAGRYGTDPALMILSGFLYEAQGKPNDAFIDYRKAFEEYRSSFSGLTGVHPPEFLVAALKELGERLGFEQQLAELELDRRTPNSQIVATATTTYIGASDRQGDSLFDADTDDVGAKYSGLFGGDSGGTAAAQVPRQRRPEQPSMGQLAVIFEVGRIGIKEEQVVTIPVPPGVGGNSGDIIRIKFPKYRSRSYQIHSARLKIVDGPVVPTEPISDLTELAEVCLADKQARIRTKAALRALGKHTIANLAERQVAKNNSSLEGAAVGWVLKIAANASEKADTRSVLELPAAISATRISLPPGSYEADIEFLSTSGAVAERERIHFDILRDQTSFIWRRACK